MSFHVGQKVVCVDDAFRWRSNFDYPCRGTVYHVRELVVALNGANCVRLEEIVNRVGISGITGEECEPMFLASRFRPIVSRKTDISALKALLVPGAKIRESA